MSTINRKQYETKTVNVERPAVVPVNISKNVPSQISKDKSGLKRTSPEIINLECHTLIPNKLPKSILNPVREGNSGIKLTQREPVNHNAARPTVSPHQGCQQVNERPASRKHGSMCFSESNGRKKEFDPRAFQEYPSQESQ
ncbi:hypothetical protein E3U43_001535 [Larimichthys crocea]|uniref:Uncharacterized protein n=1 Tax=Larimichthys crocea TaxID=215358 RepID=A0ACD3RD24_LARCR|nr:hypothetical protein E3U43_001535 [Larimichthys crocea]